MFERGDPRGVGVWVSSPRRKKIQSFKFDSLKWSFLAEITTKSAIYSHFLCKQGGDISPHGAERGGPDPPWRKP